MSLTVLRDWKAVCKCELVSLCSFLSQSQLGPEFKDLCYFEVVSLLPHKMTKV